MFYSYTNQINSPIWVKSFLFIIIIIYMFIKWSVFVRKKFEVRKYVLIYEILNVLFFLKKKGIWRFNGFGLILQWIFNRKTKRLISKYRTLSMGKKLRKLGTKNSIKLAFFLKVIYKCFVSLEKKLSTFLDEKSKILHTADGIFKVLYNFWCILFCLIVKNLKLVYDHIVRLFCLFVSILENISFLFFHYYEIIKYMEVKVYYVFNFNFVLSIQIHIYIQDISILNLNV